MAADNDETQSRTGNNFSEQEKNSERRENGWHSQEKSKKILMIEDEEIFIEMFGEKLKQDGYDVSFAQNGAWGIKEAMEKDFDLYIIDMIMPAMNGEEMITKLKMEDKTKNVPIVMLSASVEDDVVKRVKELGIQAFFLKTQLTPGELSNKISEIL